MLASTSHSNSDSFNGHYYHTPTRHDSDFEWPSLLAQTNGSLQCTLMQAQRSQYVEPLEADDGRAFSRFARLSRCCTLTRQLTDRLLRTPFQSHRPIPAETAWVNAIAQAHHLLVSTYSPRI